MDVSVVPNFFPDPASNKMTFESMNVMYHIRKLSMIYVYTPVLIIYMYSEIFSNSVYLLPTSSG